MPAQFSSSNQRTERTVIDNLRHFGMCVSDLEKAIEFYCELGGEVSSRDYEHGEFIESLLGISGVRIKTCKLLFKDNSRMELMEFTSPVSMIHVAHHDEQSGMQKMDAIGLHHIAFTVNDLQKTIAKIISLGGKTIGGTVIPGLQHSVHAVRAKHIYMRDPFGNLLHLAQDLSSFE